MEKVRQWNLSMRFFFCPNLITFSSIFRTLTYETPISIELHFHFYSFFLNFASAICIEYRFTSMENIETGLLLMAVGMTTVFMILLIVINLGKGLIYLVNKYAPEEIVVKKQPTVAARTVQPTGQLSNQETAAVVAAVSAATFGQGKVVKIEKI